MPQWYSELREKLADKQKSSFLILLGLCGVCLLLLPNLLPEKSPQPRAEPQDAGFSVETYREQLENRLTDLLEDLDGVGHVQVMITCSCSAEQVYAEAVKSAQSDRNIQQETEYIITRSGGNESALIEKTRYPAVQGAAILCTGGGHAAVQERVSRAAAALLGISPARIFVGQSSET